MAGCRACFLHARYSRPGRRYFQLSMSAIPASSSSPSAEPLRLAVDCMGGDHGPSVTLPACKAFLAAHPQAELLLVGQPEALKEAASWPRARIVPASEVVTMDDPVEVALRRKKDSSMRVALQQLKAGKDGSAIQAQACVSAGNTGALMAVAKYLLKTLEGIDRPAIATVMPTRPAASRRCWTWAPTSTAARSTCCSSR
ncbi:fatty acid synthesis protein [Ditylenchus destructor]|nr:fatty acid synthesis protein [Ditylenchus destructor]